MTQNFVWTQKFGQNINIKIKKKWLGFDIIEGNLVQYVSHNYLSLSYIDFVLYAYNNGKISVDPNL